MNVVGRDSAGGDTPAELEALRARLHSIARRRVAPDAVDDLVQEALRIVVERQLLSRSGGHTEGELRLAACFQVLRNVIGNHYQRERVRRRRLTGEDAAHGVAAEGPTPIEALESAQAIGLLERTLEVLAATDAACARYLRALAGGATPRDAARAESLEETVFYRRVYRCRQKLRALLEREGYFA